MALEKIKEWFGGKDSFQEKMFIEHNDAPQASGDLDGVKRRLAARQNVSTGNAEEKSDPVEEALRSIREEGMPNDALPPSKTQAPQSLREGNDMHPAPGELAPQKPFRSRQKKIVLSDPRHGAKLTPASSVGPSPRDRDRKHLGGFRKSVEPSPKVIPEATVAAKKDADRETPSEPVTEIAATPARDGISEIAGTLNIIRAAAVRDSETEGVSTAIESKAEPELHELQTADEAVPQKTTTDTSVELATDMPLETAIDTKNTHNEVAAQVSEGTSPEPYIPEVFVAPPFFSRNTFGDGEENEDASPIATNEKVSLSPTEAEALSVSDTKSTKVETVIKPTEVSTPEPVTKRMSATTQPEAVVVPQDVAEKTVESAEKVNTNDEFQLSPKLKAAVLESIEGISDVDEQQLFSLLGMLVSTKGALRELLARKLTKSGEPVANALENLLDEPTIWRETLGNAVRKAVNDNSAKKEKRAR